MMCYGLLGNFWNIGCDTYVCMYVIVPLYNDCFGWETFCSLSYTL